MFNHTFTPGQRVSDTGKSIVGTVADDPAMTAEYPGMVPVHWDNGDRTVSAPSILAPCLTLAPGDTVIHDATGERGTLTSTNGVSAVVLWDSTLGMIGKTPADILPVTDLEPPAMLHRELTAELSRLLTPAHQHRATEVTTDTERKERAALRAARKAGLWPLSA